MVKLSEEIGRITNILEDAIEEQDWNLVKKIIDDLDIVYDELDKQENGFQHDYD
mgnify:CR=1 FL=1|jgi:hypothetical protein